MKRLVKNVVIGAGLLSLVNVGSVVAKDDIPLLFPTNSERDVEIQISQFLEANGYHVTNKIFKKNPDDVYLTLKLGKKGTDDYDLRIVIDTTVASRNKSTGKVRERRIKILGFPSTRKVKNMSNRRAMLNFTNQWDQDYWAPQKIYLDKDNDLTLGWSINISGDQYPVHCGQVMDAIERIGSAWKDMYNRLEKQGLI